MTAEEPEKEKTSEKPVEPLPLPKLEDGNIMEGCTVIIEGSEDIDDLDIPVKETKYYQKL